MKGGVHQGHEAATDNDAANATNAMLTATQREQRRRQGQWSEQADENKKKE